MSTPWGIIALYGLLAISLIVWCWAVTALIMKVLNFTDGEKND